jgi:hypothetical protein
VGCNTLVGIGIKLAGYKHEHLHARSEVFTAVTMKNANFWDVAPCKSCGNPRLRGKYHLHFRDRKVSKESSQQRFACYMLCLFLLGLLFGLRWRKYIFPKRKLTFTGSHGIVYWKIHVCNTRLNYSTCALFTHSVLFRQTK